MDSPRLGWLQQVFDQKPGQSRLPQFAPGIEQEYGKSAM
jgi:hypothetical protein